MKTLDRDEAHQRLDAYLDARAVAQAANDPTRYGQAMETVRTLYVDLCGALGGDVVAVLLGAARIARVAFEIGVEWSDRAEAAGRSPVPSMRQMDHEDAADQRRMIAKALLMMEGGILPADLVRNAASALLFLNLGTVLPFVEPVAKRGGGGRDAMLIVAIAAGVFYRSGYYDLPVEQLLRDVAEVRSLSYNALDKWIRKLGIRSMVDDAFLQGRRDKADGKQASPPWAADFDLVELIDLFGQDWQSGANIVPIRRRH